ncbi:MAG: tRNA (guanosine(46)-N7)-methyltransferase TrmB [Planctomycetota bacterium]
MRSRTKRDRWRENQTLERVHEPDLSEIAAGGSYLRGEWGTRVFGSQRPITLELGCGQGLFAVDLARRGPEHNVVGVDVKGHRFWRGAKVAHDEGLTNAAFLRARIQWLDRFFAPGEVEQIWLTFSDPQVADKRGTKRLTSPFYLALYQDVLAAGGVLHVKTDSPEFHERTLEDGPASGMEIADACEDVHAAQAGRFDEELTASLAFRTAYEDRWIREGRTIRYSRLVKVKDPDPETLARARTMLQGPARRQKPRFPGVG